MARDDHVWVITDGRGLDAQLGRRPSRHGEVERVAAQALDNLGPVAHDELQFKPRMRAGKRRERARREILGRADDADAHGALLGARQSGENGRAV